MPLLLLPAQLGGNALGVLLSPTLPASGVEMLACFLLAYAALKTLRTACKAYAKESRDAQAASLLAGVVGDSEAPPNLNPSLQDMQVQLGNELNHSKAGLEEARQKYTEYKEQARPEKAERRGS